jgi:hypothetical protein
VIYTLFLHYPEGDAESLGQEAIEAGMAAFDAYGKALWDAGVLVSADVLQQSPASTTVRQVDGALRVQDGPYADTKEQLGGSFVLDVPDLDAAIAWAERAPSVAWGAVEIRPSAIRFLDGAWRPST